MDLWILCVVAVARLAFHPELVYLPFEAFPSTNSGILALNW